MSSRTSRRLVSVAFMVLLVVGGMIAAAMIFAPAPPEGPMLALNPEADVQELSAFADSEDESVPTSTYEGSIEPSESRAFHGSRSTLTSVQSPDGYSYSRVQEEVDWREGDDIWYGAAVYLEPGFNRAQGVGSVDILRWDNWAEHPDEADHGGLAVLNEGGLGLISEQLGVTEWELLLGPYDLPEGEWVWLEVRQRFSSTDGEAINEVWMDGERLGANTDANYFGRPITRHRVGIIGTPDPQPGELRMYVDHVVIAQDGPVIELREPDFDTWESWRYWLGQDPDGVEYLRDPIG